MKLYKTEAGIFVEQSGFFYKIDQTWDTLLNMPNLYRYLKKTIQKHLKSKNLKKLNRRYESDLPSSKPHK